MNESQQLEALQTYFEFMSMNGGVRIFQTAQQMGIFKAITNGPMTVGEVAAMCETQQRPTALLLDGLCGLRAVQKGDGKYSLSPVMQFLAGNYQDLSNSYWDHLPKYLKTGVPMAKMDDPQESEKQYQAQVTALDWMMRPSAEVAAAMLGIGDQLKGLNILDVGCGTAVWSLAIARRDQSANVTGLDWPSVLQIAQASAKASGMLDRFTAMPGNYHDVDLPAETFDMAIVGNVTHIETPEGNKSLFAKLYEALNPGGKLVVFDVFGDQESGKLQTALYAIGLALRTERGQVYSKEDLRSFVGDAGFSNVMVRSIEITPNTMGMLVGSK
jgi:2-polyprenyl-3-methyl-5-hydroxy-6-metoxy-1,4-benzoquinol methylase